MWHSYALDRERGGVSQSVGGALHASSLTYPRKEREMLIAASGISSVNPFIKLSFHFVVCIVYDTSYSSYQIDKDDSEEMKVK